MVGSFLICYIIFNFALKFSSALGFVLEKSKIARLTLRIYFIHDNSPLALAVLGPLGGTGGGTSSVLEPVVETDVDAVLEADAADVSRCEPELR